MKPLRRRRVVLLYFYFAVVTLAGMTDSQWSGDSPGRCSNYAVWLIPGVWSLQIHDACAERRRKTRIQMG